MFLQPPGKKPGGVFHSRLGSRPSHISKLSSGLGLGMRKKKLDHSNGGHTQLMARASLAPIEQQQQSHELAQMNALKITQEELQRDLETLGLQQQESQRLLDNAKNFKERRVHQHAELESKLEHIKYKVGQERAELQRRHHLLSSGQRALSLARLSGDRTGDDLRALDRKLKQVLETKRTLFFYQRKQDRLLHDLRADLSSLAHEKTEATAQVHTADQNLKKLKLTEHSLRQRIQSESKKLAAFSQQTTLLRAETMSMEHMIDEVTDALELSEAAHAKCAAETVSEEDRHNKAVIALEAKIEGKYSVHRKLSQEMQVLRQTALDHQSDLHLAWERTIYAQIANGMTPSKSQKESNIPPVLEFSCVEVKVETETKACEEEAQIIEDLKATLSSFKDQLDEMEERANTSSEKVELEQGAINNARKTEESRRDEASKFLIDIVTLRRENEHVRASFDTLRSLRDDQNAGIKRSIDTVRQENGQAEHNRSLAQHRLSKVATEVRSTSASALREKEAIALKLAEFESEISTVHQCNLSAKEELNRLSSIIESQDKLSRNSLGLSQSAAKKNIAEILNEYPDLESVRFGYDPKKTLDEQADESLKLIVAHCKHRLNSAKKMQAGLREAAKLEDLELREMQKAAAIESKRKFKIREYRKHRLLSGTSGNAIKQSNLKDEKKHKSRRSLQSIRVKASARIGDEKTEKTRRDKKKMRREELQHQTEIALENSELNSVAKPRDLLEVFSRVGDDGGKSTYDLEACAVLTQTTAGSEKKVTWEEDNGKEKRTSKISKKDCTRGRKTKECLSKDSTEKLHIPKLAPSSLSATMLDAGFQEVSALLVEKEASSHRISSSKPVVQKSYILPSVDRISKEPRSQDLKILLSCKSIGHTGEKTRSNSSRFGNPKKRDIDVTTNPRREMPHSFGSTKPISKTRGENAQSLKERSGSSTSHRAFEDKTNSKDQERRTTSHQREKGKRSHRSSADVRTASTDHKKMNYHLSLSHNSNPSLKRNSCQTSGLSSKERPAKSRRRLKSRSSDVLKNQIQTFGDERYSFGFATS